MSPIFTLILGIAIGFFLARGFRSRLLGGQAPQIQTLQAQTAGDLGELEQAVLRRAFGG